MAEHGCINLVGYHLKNGGIRQIDVKTWNWKALTVINGHVRRDDEKLASMRRGMEFIASGKLDVAALCRFYPLSQAPQAFADILAQKPGLFKAVLVPDAG